MVADATLLRTPICAALLLLMPIAKLFTGCDPVRRPERAGRTGKLACLNPSCVCGCAHRCCPSGALANIMLLCEEAGVREAFVGCRCYSCVLMVVVGLCLSSVAHVQANAWSLSTSINGAVTC